MWQIGGVKYRRGQVKKWGTGDCQKKRVLCKKSGFSWTVKFTSKVLYSISALSPHFFIYLYIFRCLAELLRSFSGIRTFSSDKSGRLKLLKGSEGLLNSTWNFWMAEIHLEINEQLPKDGRYCSAAEFETWLWAVVCNAGQEDRFAIFYWVH